jgi:hypothetical protein
MKGSFQKIELSGQVYNVKFGWMAFALFEQYTGLKALDSLNQDIGIEGFTWLLFCGMEAGAKANKEEFNLTYDALLFMLDSEPMTELLKKVTAMVQESLPGADDNSGSEGKP